MSRILEHGENSTDSFPRSHVLFVLQPDTVWFHSHTIYKSAEYLVWRRVITTYGYLHGLKFTLRPQFAVYRCSSKFAAKNGTLVMGQLLGFATAGMNSIWGGHETQGKSEQIENAKSLSL